MICGKSQKSKRKNNSISTTKLSGQNFKKKFRIRKIIRGKSQKSKQNNISVLFSRFLHRFLKSQNNPR